MPAGAMDYFGHEVAHTGLRCDEGESCRRGADIAREAGIAFEL